MHESPSSSIIGSAGDGTILHLQNLCGVASDYDTWLASVLFLFSSVLCLANYFYLRNHKLSRQQLESTRVYQILRERRSIAVFQFSSWQRVVGNFCFKTILPQLVYWAICHKNYVITFAGVLIATFMLGYVVFLTLKAILDPKTSRLRRYLCFQGQPLFVITRVFFEFFRRFIYFGFGLTCISFGLHRLALGEFTFASNRDVSLFLLHLSSNFTGITSLGVDGLSYSNSIALVFEILRTVFGFGVFLMFANTIITTLLELRESQRQRPKRTPLGWKQEDLRAGVELALEATLPINARFLPDTVVVAKLLQSEVILATFHGNLEQVFERKWTRLFSEKMTISELIELIRVDLSKIITTKQASSIK